APGAGGRVVDLHGADWRAGGVEAAQGVNAAVRSADSPQVSAGRRHVGQGVPGTLQLADEVQPDVHAADGHGLGDRVGQPAAAGRDAVVPGTHLQAVAARAQRGGRTAALDADGDAAEPLADVVLAVAVVVVDDHAREERTGVRGVGCLDRVVVGKSAAGGVLDDADADLLVEA